MGQKQCKVYMQLYGSKTKHTVLATVSCMSSNIEQQDKLCHPHTHTTLLLSPPSLLDISFSLPLSRARAHTHTHIILASFCASSKFSASFVYQTDHNTSKGVCCDTVIHNHTLIDSTAAFMKQISPETMKPDDL